MIREVPNCSEQGPARSAQPPHPPCQEDGCAGVREGAGLSVLQLPFLVMDEVLGQFILGSVL